MSDLTTPRKDNTAHVSSVSKSWEMSPSPWLCPHTKQALCQVLEAYIKTASFCSKGMGWISCHVLAGCSTWIISIHTPSLAACFHKHFLFNTQVIFTDYEKKPFQWLGGIKKKKKKDWLLLLLPHLFTRWKQHTSSSPPLHSSQNIHLLLISTAQMSS